MDGAMANQYVQTDLRDFLAAVEEGGELKTVAGAHWDKEIGAVTEVLYREKVDRAPLLLFDEVPGYKKGFRCLYGMLGSPFRLALGMGIDPAGSDDRRAMLDAYRERIKKYEPIPPNVVTEAPILENIDRDDDVDLTKFPVPVHHEKDGGRYIGTACGVITKDPDTGRVNVGTYRVMLNGKNIATSYISNGKQGRIQRDKYLKEGKRCPMIIVVGIDPATYIARATRWPITSLSLTGRGVCPVRLLMLSRARLQAYRSPHAPNWCLKAGYRRMRQRLKVRSANGPAITRAPPRKNRSFISSGSITETIPS